MEERERMVEYQIKRRGISDPAVLAAMRKVPRHKFLPTAASPVAYGDFPLTIGEGQTISQPYIVALMTEMLKLKPENRILEIGTGSGYQTAVLAEIVKEVYTVEIISSLTEEAQIILDELGYKNIRFRCADGGKGWEEEAPFDGIITTAAAPNIPKKLTDQLKIGGRMVIPVGPANSTQILYIIQRTESGLDIVPNIAVRFVPMTGTAQFD
jgi:protein-L-isoaspartate(D-aspartate) O-methyltransferase